MEAQQKTMKVVYTVVERLPGKSFWTRVGVGFVNRDGSLNLRLDAIPINGTLQVRDWEPSEARPPGDRELAPIRKAPRDLDGTSAAPPQRGLHLEELA